MVRPRARAISIMERMREIARLSVSRAKTNDLSILSSSTDSSRSCDIDEYPTPKSSMEILTPNDLNLSRLLFARAGSWVRLDSVTSRTNCSAGRWNHSSMREIESGSCGSNRSQFEMFTLIWSACPFPWRRASSWIARSSTARVSGMMRPALSASGMKSSGWRRPSVGCCHLTSASTPYTEPVSTWRVGWNCSVSRRRSIAVRRSLIIARCSLVFLSMSSLYTCTEFRLRFASYIATSALRTSSTCVVPCWGQMATPMLALTRTLVPSSDTGSASAFASSLAIAIGSDSASITRVQANSSPPVRAIGPRLPIFLAKRRPMIFKSSSPWA